MRLATRTFIAALLLAPAWAGSAGAHSAGALDPHGCHSDARRSRDAYHCHRGQYNGLRFRSKASMIENKKAGMTAAQIRAQRSDGAAVTDSADAPAVAAPESREQQQDSWTVYGWLSGNNPDDSPTDVGTGGQVVPKGIESRLRTLQRLHSEGLISDEEYAAKRADILGEL